MTSGIGGIFPKDIPIGKIVDSHPVEYGLNLAARVKLNANLSSLEEVWVMLEP
jgi:rod shape-determining protein MreC